MVRIKHRYLLVNILYPDNQSINKASDGVAADAQLPWTVRFRKPTSDLVDARMIARVVRDGVSELFGDYGIGMIGGSLKVTYFSSATSTTIIRVSRGHYRMVWAALSFATSMPKPIHQPCVFQVVRVSGTIRKAEEEAIRRARLHVQRTVETSSTNLAQRTGKPNEEIMGDYLNAEHDDLGSAAGIVDLDDLEDGSEDD